MDEMTHADASRPATLGDVNAATVLMKNGLDSAVGKFKGELDSAVGKFKGELDSAVGKFKGELDSAVTLLRDEIRGEINRLDAKIDKGIHTLAVEIVKTQAGLVRLEERMDTLPTKDDFNRLLGAVESFAGKTQTYDRAAVLHGQALTELQVQYKDHEARIKALEAGNA